MRTPEQEIQVTLDVIRAQSRVRYGERIQFITRANGLRAKVAELVLANNYGDPWQ